ncbi:MAG: stage 0 sporulation protein [Erysipelotrichaceae bacterium]|nr:stage 0 sporulation protein [Erysipelotrichaceae bacterium]
MEELQHEVVNYKYSVSVKFKGSKKAYHFGTDEAIYNYGDKVVVETIRGIELGDVISELRLCEDFPNQKPTKPVLRKASEKDIEDYNRNKEDEADALQKCQNCIEKLKLEMKLISAEYTLDRSKVIFSYVSDDRVDFRELLKELASIFRCRIELRQIGPRDKAKIVGGLGSCGMETCCSRYMEEFDVISINMAKNQLLALNIQKLSGQCGKLMCCLSFEDEMYKEQRKGLPKMNAQVVYNGERFRIQGMNLLNQTAKLGNKENMVIIPLDELKELMNQMPKENTHHEKSKEFSK